VSGRLREGSKTSSQPTRQGSLSREGAALMASDAVPLQPAVLDHRGRREEGAGGVAVAHAGTSEPNSRAAGFRKTALSRASRKARPGNGKSHHWFPAKRHASAGQVGAKPQRGLGRPCEG
jgi:hypothetical protein